jgi:hypothetical protein
MTAQQLGSALGGVGQAARAAGGGGGGGMAGAGMMPPGGGVQSMGNPAAMMQLLQTRLAQRPVPRIPGLLQR